MKPDHEMEGSSGLIEGIKHGFASKVWCSVHLFNVDSCVSVEGCHISSFNVWWGGHNERHVGGVCDGLQLRRIVVIVNGVIEALVPITLKH